LFSSPEALQRAHDAQKNHWLTFVLRGRFDEDYMRATRAIGQKHFEVGVDLMFYTGSYSIVLDKLIALIMRLYRDRPDEKRRIAHAINQVIFLDMGLAASVYYDLYIKGIEELSEELNFQPCPRW